MSLFIWIITPKTPFFFGHLLYNIGAPHVTLFITIGSGPTMYHPLHQITRVLMVIAQQSPPDTLQCSWMLVSASGLMKITKKKHPGPGTPKSETDVL